MGRPSAPARSPTPPGRPFGRPGSHGLSPDAYGGCHAVTSRLETDRRCQPPAATGQRPTLRRTAPSRLHPVTAARGDGRPRQRRPPLRATRAALLDDRELTGTAWCRRYAGAADAWLGRVFAQRHRRRRQGGRPCWPSAGTAGASWRRAATWTCCSSTTAGAGSSRSPTPSGIRSGTPACTSTTACGPPRRSAPPWTPTSRWPSGCSTPGGSPATPTWPRRCSSRALEQWKTRAGRWLPAVDEVTRARHDRFGDLAFLLEPDLKEARGGQRDLHLLRSLGRVVPVLAGVLDDPALGRSADTIVAGPGRAAARHRPADQHAAAPGPGRRGRPPWATPTPTP